MKRVDTELPGVCVLEPKVFGDARGFFMESWNRRTFAELGIACEFVQDNHSRSRGGVLRGLHYQIARAQDKLVRVIAGAVYDVAADIRRGSPTFGRWYGCELSAENRRMLFVPKGFAHGFYVLGDGAEFCYKVSDYYAPEAERGVIWNDADLAVDWPVDGEPQLSDKDRAAPALAAIAEADLPAYPGAPA